MTTIERLSNRELIDHVYIKIAGTKICESITDWSDLTKWRQVVELMPEPVGIVYRIGILDLQVVNGGFIQYFDNRYGIFAYETLSNLKTVGADLSHNILKEVLEIVNYQKLPIDKFVEFVKQREYDNEPTIGDRLDRLDNQYCNLGENENLEELVGIYLRKHLNEID